MARQLLRRVTVYLGEEEQKFIHSRTDRCLSFALNPRTQICIVCRRRSSGIVSSHFVTQAVRCLTDMIA